MGQYPNAILNILEHKEYMEGMRARFMVLKAQLGKYSRDDTNTNPPLGYSIIRV